MSDGELEIGTEAEHKNRRVVRLRASTSDSGVMLTLRQAFGVFYQAKAAQRLRDLTLRDHRKHFEYLMDWIQDAHPELTFINEMTAQTLREYIHYMSYEKPLYNGHPYVQHIGETRRGLAPGAVNVRINTLKTMFRWLHREGIIPTAPSQNLSRQKVDEDRIGAFTEEQVALLFG